MADDTDVDQGLTVDFNSPGYVTCWYNDAGTLRWIKIPIADFAAVKAKADLSLTSDDVGTAAFHDDTHFQTATDAASAAAAQSLTNAELQQRIDALEAIIGAGGIVVYEPDVYESGVYV